MIPSKIKISVMEYDITEEESVVMDGKEVWGSIDYEDMKICIKKSIGNKRKRHVLAHEITHAIAEAYDINYKEMETEDITDLLASGIINLIIDNPDVINYIKNV